MPFNATTLNVAIASPSDLIEERKAIRETIYEWNSDHSEMFNVILMPKMWEYDSVPDLRNRAQSILNEQIIYSSDALIALFWTRLGSHTGVYKSGTVKEIEEFLQTKKPIAVYFSQKPSNPEMIDPKQITELRNFKSGLEGLYGGFSEIPELKQKVMKFLNKTVQNFIMSNKASNEEIPNNEEKLEVRIDKQPLTESTLVKEDREIFVKSLNEALSANADGYWLSIVCDYGKGYTKFNSLNKDFATNWALELAYAGFGTKFTSSQSVGTNFVRVSVPGDDIRPMDFNCIYYNDGVVKVQWRGDGDSISLAWILVRCIVTLRALISKPIVQNQVPIQIGFTLSHAPQHGIDTSGVFQCTPTRSDYRYLSVHWKSKCDTSVDIDSSIRQFVYHTLEEWGYKYFEDAIERLSINPSLFTLSLVEKGLINKS